MYSIFGMLLFCEYPLSSFHDPCFVIVLSLHDIWFVILHDSCSVNIYNIIIVNIPPQAHV